jgi:dynein heavy chain
MMKILDCFFADYVETEIRKIAPEEIEDFESVLEPIFLFALVWSIGCTTNLEGREKFDQRLRELIDPNQKYKFPSSGLVYDYCFDKTTKEWKTWNDTVPVYQVDNKLSYGEIVVPTFDSIRMKYLKRMLIMNKKHVLSPGPTGTGKTVNINELLVTGLPEEYQSIPVTFSA